MTGPVWALFAIPAVAFVVLAVMVGGVYFADAHPGWKGQSLEPQERASLTAGYPEQRPEQPAQVAQEAVSPEAGLKAGGGVPERGGGMNEQAQPHRVVIVGGGFAGLFAARALRSREFAVTLIDRSEHHLFQPMLYQCATGILSEGQIASPLRYVLRKHRNLDCVMAQVLDVDADGQRVICERPFGEHAEFGYDSLIVAVGLEQSYFGHDEFSEWAPGMKDISDALTIRQQLFLSFEMADSATDPAERRRWLTFALVGAGPTGVELAGQIRELATKTLRNEFRNIEPEDARVLLFDGGSTPLASFGPKLAGKATESLRKLGVEQHMHSIATNVDGDGVVVRSRDGTESRYEAATVVWSAGVAAPKFAAALAKATGANQDRSGRIAVGDDLTIPGHPEIFVAGDLMSTKLPGVAEVAMQSGHYAGKRIRLQVTGHGRQKPFKYFNLGLAAYISRGRAVLSVGPLHLSGFLAWLGWLFIHIAFLTGYRNRAGAILSWWITFTRDLRRERSFTSHAVGRTKDIYLPEPETGSLPAGAAVPGPRQGSAAARSAAAANPGPGRGPGAGPSGAR
jgi:NADH:ubiquinone reductase (H+-translocating)